jgi:hypothetical protein
MEDLEFKEFNSIERLSGNIVITEKIHGSNAQILVAESSPGMTDVKAGSRTRWLTLDDDNYGFARKVHENFGEISTALGLGRHYGEWYGLGINSGYHLKEKRLALFNTHRWADPYKQGLLPSWVDVVPVLYQGPWREGIITETMTKLKLEGSAISKGFMKPEGVVIRFDRNGAMFKHVFDPEESAWKGTPKEKGVIPQPDLEKVRAWLQPIRLEKLLSKDERYTREYPTSLVSIAKDYVADLEKEEQLKDLDEATTKSLRKQVFPWIKEMMKERGYSA